MTIIHKNNYSIENRIKPVVRNLPGNFPAAGLNTAKYPVQPCLGLIKNYPLAFISFKGTEQELKNTELYPAFKEQVGASNSRIYEFIEKSHAKPSETSEFLNAVLEHPKTRNKFIETITSDPRKSQKIFDTLKKKMTGRYFNSWYKKYKKAYHEFTEDFFNNEKITVHDMLKRQPNWGLWRLKEKYRAQEGDDNFVIGKVPKEFNGADNFYRLIDGVTEHIKEVESQAGSFDTPTDIKGATVIPLQEGHSDKKTFVIMLGDKQYKCITKVDRNPDHKNIAESYKEARAMKADSIFLNAIVDYYLNCHNAENAAQFKFYDYFHNVAIYEFISGEPLKMDKKDMHEDRINSEKLNKEIVPDLNALGIYCNDTGIDNYHVIQGGHREQKAKMIDSGNVTFADPLRPGAMGYHFCIPNSTGHDILYERYFLD